MDFVELIPISYVCKAQGYVRIVAVEILLMLSGLINHLSTEVFYCWRCVGLNKELCGP